MPNTKIAHTPGPQGELLYSLPMECGCRLWTTKTIELCPTHAAALDLLKLLKKVRVHLIDSGNARTTREMGYSNTGWLATPLGRFGREVEAAIAKATLVPKEKNPNA